MKSMKKLLAGILLACFTAFTSIALAQTSVLMSTQNVSNKVQTYRAAIETFTLAASATDVFIINGSATKTVYIKSLRITGTVTTATNGIIFDLYKRTVADTAGTSTSPTAVAMDSLNVAATAVIKAYTVNPTTGAGTIIGSVKQALPAPATATGGFPPIEWTFGGLNPSQYVVLRGVAQGLAINMAGVTNTGGVLTIEIEWLETPA